MTNDCVRILGALLSANIKFTCIHIHILIHNLQETRM